MSRALRNLVVGQADHVAEQERRLQVDVQALDRAPERLDRLESLDRRSAACSGRTESISTVLGRRSRARYSSNTRFLVTWNSQVVNFERNEKPGKALVHAEEDLLRQILGQAAIADQART